MRLILFLITIAGCALCAGISTFSFAAAPLGAEVNLVPPAPQNMHLGWVGTYFYSSENFSSSGGGFSTIGNSGKFQEFKNFFRLEYDLNSRFRLKSDFGFHNVMTEAGNYSNSNMHMDQVGLGLEWWNALGRMPFITHTRLGVPLYKPDFASTDAFATDGAMSAEVGVFIRPRIRSLIGKFGAGYLWRSENLSGLIPWTAGVTYVLPVGQIGGGARGFHTVVSDGSSTVDQAKRTLAIQNIQGGSLKYHSVDPSLQQAFVETRWGIVKSLDFSTDAAYDLNGKSYGKGFYLGVGVHWLMNWGGGFGHSEGYDDYDDVREERFEVERGDDRQELFRQADPSVGARPAEVRPAEARPAGKAKKRGSGLPSPNVKLKPAKKKK